MICQGYLPFSDEAHRNRFVDPVLRIKRKDFLAFAEEKAELLVSNAKALATPEGAPYVYLRGRLYFAKPKLDDLGSDGPRTSRKRQGL